MHESLRGYCVPALWHTGMHTKWANTAHLGAQPSCKMSKGAHFGCAVTASQMESFRSNDIKVHKDVMVLRQLGGGIKFTPFCTT